MFRRILLTSSLLTFLAACVPATSTLLPTLVRTPETVTPSATALPKPVPSSLTPTPLPTSMAVSPTSEVVLTDTPTDIPSDTPLPFQTLEFPTPETVTPLPQPSADSGTIQFLSPGPLSKIVSPVGIRGYVVPGYNQKAYLDLYGENGQLLASRLLQLYTPYKWAIFYYELSFQIGTVGELGRLSLSTQDEYGRVTAVNSVHLLLLLEGSSIINPPGNLQERCVIDQPKTGQRLSGGVLNIAGRMRPFNKMPLTVELVARDGEVIGSQIVPISPASDGGYVSFQANIPYNIPNSSWILLVISQLDDRISGVMYLTSQEFFLNP